VLAQSGARFVVRDHTDAQLGVDLLHRPNKLTFNPTIHDRCHVLTQRRCNRERCGVSDDSELFDHWATHVEHIRDFLDVAFRAAGKRVEQALIEPGIEVFRLQRLQRRDGRVVVEQG
jgi:hypothetical protein